MPGYARTIAIACFLFTAIFSAAHGQDRKVIESCKAASFLVELPNKDGYATAFCIHSNGLFVTNNHVVESLASGDSVSLIMNSGTDEQAVLKAKVIRQDEKSDLALLKCEDKQKEFPVLKLAQNPGVFETMSVIAFGFPFGMGLALEEGSFPAISVNVGKITAIRREKKEVQLLQLDAALNPGNSGGAVVNESGEVIGVVSFGVAASGVNFAIPVEKVNKLLITPDVEAKVPSFNEQNFDQPHEVEVVLTSLVGELLEPTVEFWLRKGTNQPKMFVLPKKAGNKYSGLVAGGQQSPNKELNGKIEFSSGKIEAKIVNEKHSIAGKEHYLSDISSVVVANESAAEAEVTFVNGETKKVPVKQLPTIRIDLGDYPASINLAKAKQFEVEKTTSSEEISYIIIVKNAGKEIYRSTAAQAMEDASNIAANDSPFDSISAATKKTSLRDGIVKVPLPGTITDVVHAHGGDFLLVTLGTSKKLVVLDIAQAAVVKILPLSSDDVLVAGTQDHIVVLDRNKSILERYSLKSFKRELAIKPPFSGVIKSITAGSASQGPLLVHKSVGTDALAQATFIAIDLKSFKELPIASNPNQGHYSSFRDAVHVRASSNGRVFGMWATSHSPQGILSMVLTDSQMLSKYEHDSAGHVVPTADGTHLLTGARGVFTSGLKNLANKASRTVRVPSIPTSHPRFYVSVPTSPGAQHNMGPEPFKGVKPGLHELGSDSAILELPDLELGTSDDDGSWSTNDFSLDKRVYLNISQNRLISVPFTNDVVIVKEFNFNEELKKSNSDYFFVSSTPNRIYSPGKSYSYQVVVESNKKKLQYEIASGPMKMEISPKGKITWNVPKSFQDETVDVIVSISDGESMQTYDSFTIYRDSK